MMHNSRTDAVGSKAMRADTSISFWNARRDMSMDLQLMVSQARKLECLRILNAQDPLAADHSKG